MSKFWNKIFGKRQGDTVAEVKPQQEIADDDKHSYRYSLQYKFIPDLVAGVSKGEISPNAILATEGWEKARRYGSRGKTPARNSR